MISGVSYPCRNGPVLWVKRLAALTLELNETRFKSSYRSLWIMYPSKDLRERTRAASLTSAYSLSLEEWVRIFGCVWKKV